MNFKMHLICEFNKAISSKFLESFSLMLSAPFCICEPVQAGLSFLFTWFIPHLNIEVNYRFSYRLLKGQSSATPA